MFIQLPVSAKCRVQKVPTRESCGHHGWREPTGKPFPSSATIIASRNQTPYVDASQLLYDDLQPQRLRPSTNCQGWKRMPLANEAFDVLPGYDKG